MKEINKSIDIKVGDTLLYKNEKYIVIKECDDKFLTYVTLSNGKRWIITFPKSELLLYTLDGLKIVK